MPQVAPTVADDDDNPAYVRLPTHKYNPLAHLTLPHATLPPSNFDSAAACPCRTRSKPVATRAAPAAPAAAPRTWGKVATPAPAAEASEDASMPSLAEAYKAPAASEAGPSAGPSAAKKKANRQKA